MRLSAETCVCPAQRIAGAEPYTSPRPSYPIELWLNGNEGMPPSETLLGHVQARFTELANSYPSVVALETLIAERFGLSNEQVLITEGADDALYRACQALLEAGRELVLPIPTFEMHDRYARLAGGDVIEVDWTAGPYPVDTVIAAATDRTALIAVVSPNNPTGAVVRAAELERLSRAIPQALLLVDLAYTEFADVDLTAAALGLPNALVVRTLSKAWGLAGLRVGYALGPPAVIKWLRVAGNPYAVSGPSAALAEAQLLHADAAMRAFVQRVRAERSQLYDALSQMGASPLPSQANFVLARFPDARKVWQGLARRGIAVRAFPGHARLNSYLRISCPGEQAAFARLLTTLRQVAGESSQENSI